MNDTGSDSPRMHNNRAGSERYRGTYTTRNQPRVDLGSGLALKKSTSGLLARHRSKRIAIDDIEYHERVLTWDEMVEPYSHHRWGFINPDYYKKLATALFLREGFGYAHKIGKTYIRFNEVCTYMGIREQHGVYSVT